MFEWMEIVNQVYKGVTTYKTTNRADANHAICIRKSKGGGSNLPTNPKKGRPGNHKKDMQAI